jgi:signal transduction histidine kinase/CheY-like chemotaxis protein/ABC-type amino acid transport substrate-binding protein
MARTAFACSLAGVLAGLPAAEAPPPLQISANPPALLVGGTTDNYPYSYLDENQQLTGFAVEVFDAVARQMHIRYQRVLGPGSEIADRFLAGNLTVHPFFTKAQSRVINAEYSVPFVSLQMTLFTRRGDARITSLAELTRTPFVVTVGGAGRDYTLADGIPLATFVRTANPDALRQLADGKTDGAIMTRFAGLATIDRLGLKNVVPSSVALPDPVRDYRFAVIRGESQLLARLNEGLASIQRTGEFDAIHQKWFGHFEPRHFTREEVTVYVAGALALALAVTFWALLRQRQLRRRLSRQADELADSRAILAEAQQFARVGHWRRIFATGELIWSEETFRIHERDPALGAPTMDELLGWVSASERVVWETSARRARDEGLTYEFDTTIEPHPGLRKIIHVRGRATRDVAGEINGLFGTVQDITPWREAEHALLRSERLLRAIYDNVPFAIGVVEFRDGLWRNVSINPGAMKLLDLTSPPPAGLTLAELGFNAERQQSWHSLFDRATTTAAPSTTERRDPEKNRDYVISVVPLGRSGGDDRCGFFVEDITARKQKDAEISQGRRLRAIGELVGGIAHEFNNLLTPILLKADLLKSDWKHEPALCEDLQVIADTARRSADLTRRLLTFGRRADVRPALFTLPAIVEGNFKLLRHTIDRRIILAADLPTDLPALYLNSGDMQQVLLNLMLNARDTLAEKLAAHPAATWSPRIQVQATTLPGLAAMPADSAKASPPTWIKFTCEDNGLGMRPEVIERIFEPFYTTKQVGQGTGLGLATVWHLVTEMGGRVEVNSTPGQGTAFHICLPVFPAPAGAPGQSAPPFAATPAPAPRPTEGRPCVLLAEDEPFIAEIVTHVAQMLGCAVTHTPDGRTAWEKISAAPAAYHAVVLDLNMPGITGLDLLRRARQFGFDRPVIVTSGRIGDDERQELVALGVSAILQKPFTVDQLIAALAVAGIRGSVSG